MLTREESRFPCLARLQDNRLSMTVPGPKYPGLSYPSLVFALIVIIKLVTTAP